MARSRLPSRPIVGAAFLVIALAFVPGALSGNGNGAPSGAVSTTTDPAVDNGGTGTPALCANGDPGPSGPSFTPAVNCNIYTAKQYVWLSGLPGTAALADGTYFFSVMETNGDTGGNTGWKDGDSTNLSWQAGDTFDNRIFEVSGGRIVYPAPGLTSPGTHAYDDSSYAPATYLNAAPYADETHNNGGEYKLAVCALGFDAVGSPSDDVPASSCKTDDFKVQPQESAAVTPALSTVIHNTEGTPVTEVPVGAYVYDTATLDPTIYGVPTGTVTFEWFTNGMCTGEGSFTDPVPVDESGFADGSAFTEEPMLAVDHSFSAHFTSGDPSQWTDADSACETLSVFDP